MKNMWKLFVLLVVITLLTGCALPPQPEESIQIGIMTPASGPISKTGESVLRGVTLAAQEIQSPYSIIIEDDKCDGTTGITVARKLVEVDNVDAILGSVCTAAILPAAPYLEEMGVPTITTGLVLQKTALAGPWHFSFLPEMKYQMNAIVGYFSKEKIKTVAVIAVNDDLGIESIRELRAALASSDTKIVAEEYFAKADSDFRAQLLKIKETKPEAIYIMGYVPNIIGVIKESQELGISSKLFTWSLFEDPSVLSSLGDLAENIVYTYPEDPRPLPVKKMFREKYLEIYGEEPDLYAANAYDSFKILAGALSQCGEDRNCVKNKLSTLNNYEGANGFISVNEQGVGQREEVTLKIVENGRFSMID